MNDKSQLPDDVLEVLKTATTGMVVDALAISGIRGAIRGVRPARGFEDTRVMGPAVTVQFGQPRPGNPKMSNYDVIRGSPPGSVLVIDGKGLDDHFTGDNQGHVAKRRGLAGIVVYGGARDVAGFRNLGMPLYCMGSSTAANASGLQITGRNVPIEIGGVTVKPGDIVVADEDGVVVIPAESIEDVANSIRTVIAVENEMEEGIRSDAPVEALKAITAKKKPRKG